MLDKFKSKSKNNLACNFLQLKIIFQQQQDNLVMQR